MPRRQSDQVSASAALQRFDTHLQRGDPHDQQGQADAVERLLGMDFDAFSRSVLLAQNLLGGFDSFPVKVGNLDVLSRIRGIPITTWSMIGGEKEVRHLGPVAEDFYAAFPLGLGNTTIGMGNIDGVNLAAAKALEARTAHLQQQLDDRTARVQALEALLAQAMVRLDQMDARLRAAEGSP